MNILANLLTINGTDVFSKYGVFLAEEKAGDMNNFSALYMPSEAKSYTAVDFREEDGEQHSDTLQVNNEARDVTLTFALVADSRSEWLSSYEAFISLLKSGWLLITFTQLDITLRVFYKKMSKFTAMTNLWVNGQSKYASRFQVTFREPEPFI